MLMEPEAINCQSCIKPDPGYFTCARRSFAPIAGFPLRSNKAFKGAAVVNYCPALAGITRLPDPANSGEMGASHAPVV